MSDNDDISRQMAPYQQSLAGTILAAREAVMAPIRPALRKSNITDQQWRVLRVLVGADALDARGIATAAMLHPPSVTRILKELGDRGLINRTLDPQDGRRSVIVATAMGHDLVDHTANDTVPMLAHYAQAFGPERLAALRQELTAFITAITPLAPED